MTVESGREFRQKLWLLLIDRALIGALLVSLGLFIESSLDRQRAALQRQQTERDRAAEQRERVREVTLGVSQVFVEIVAENREPILAGVGELLAILNEYQARGRVNDSAGRARLRDIVENIENSLSQLASINPDLPEKAVPFVNQVRSIRSALVSIVRDREALQEDAQNLLASHADLLVELRRTSVLALEADRKAVEALLRESATSVP